MGWNESNFSHYYFVFILGTSFSSLSVSVSISFSISLLPVKSTNWQRKKIMFFLSVISKIRINISKLVKTVTHILSLFSEGIERANILWLIFWSQIFLGSWVFCSMNLSVIFWIQSKSYTVFVFDNIGVGRSKLFKTLNPLPETLPIVFCYH